MQKCILFSKLDSLDEPNKFSPKSGISFKINDDKSYKIAYSQILPNKFGSLLTQGQEH